MSALAKASGNVEQKLSQAAQACLKQAVEIPSMPLFHMGNIAVFKSKSSFDLIQAAIDYLTCKAKGKIVFSTIEKNFLIELYESFWWGGHVKGMPEAAKLANHYVNGNGLPVLMDSKPYESSMIVQDVMEAMKAFIKEQADKKRILLYD